MNDTRQMQLLQEAKFALHETALYLDTHPDDSNALAYFAKKQEQSQAARRRYEEEIGPLSYSGVKTQDGWTWGNAPWPWQKGAM